MKPKTENIINSIIADNFLLHNKTAEIFRDYVQKLEEATDSEIRTFENLLENLQKRITYFGINVYILITTSYAHAENGYDLWLRNYVIKANIK